MALLMYLKQPNFICLCANIWLATLTLVNSEIFSKLQSETKTQASEPMVVAALGRPLYLGMLYDSRKDSFIPGITLWDKKSLSDNLDSHTKSFTNLKYSSSDSLSSKSSLLDVSASLKVSFMAGLVDVEGSGKFLHDTKSSNQQSRVTMYHSETTRFEQLTMSQLGHFTYPQVFEQKTATHVVTAVLYGAQAFMVFDRTFSEEENEQKIEGELDVIVQKIPSFSTDGKGSVNMKEHEKNMSEKITCTFYGDVILDKNPTTYMEAIQTYKNLPALLKKPQNAVPMKVWLYPLHLLESRAAQLKREITTSLISSIESVIEELGEVERTYNDLSENPLVNSFSDVNDRHHSFKDSFSTYKTTLLEAVGSVLPAIRGGEMEEKSLEDILKIHRSSPFTADTLKHWLHDAKTEIDFLSSLTKELKGIEIEDNIMTHFFDPNIDLEVCLTLTSLKYEDAYLKTLRNFLRSAMFKELDGSNALFSVKSVKKWFSDPSVIAKMIQNVSQFRRFAKANKDEKNIHFAISAISDPSITGSSIYLIKNGVVIDKHFQPMSKPDPPIVKSVQDKTVSLELQKSSSGERALYRVEYKPVIAHSGAEQPWASVRAYDKDFTLTGLEHGNHYLIRYRIVGEVGVSEASDTASVTFSTNAFGTVVRFDGGFFTIMKEMCWPDSRDFCREHGGDLVTIKSIGEQRRVYSVVNKMGKSVWIGLTDQEKKGTWKWVDNSPLNQAFWRKGEPNDLNGNEDCVVFNAGPTMDNWNDIPCFIQSYFLCK